MTQWRAGVRHTPVPAASPVHTAEDKCHGTHYLTLKDHSPLTAPHPSRSSPFQRIFTNCFLGVTLVLERKKESYLFRRCSSMRTHDPGLRCHAALSTRVQDAPFPNRRNSLETT